MSCVLGTVVFNPCTSKNALCVGSIDNRNDDDDGTLDSSRVSYFSSQGPTGYVTLYKICLLLCTSPKHRTRLVSSYESATSQSVLLTTAVVFALTLFCRLSVCLCGLSLPPSDGRIKPDVVAPGFKIVSALSGGQSGGDKFCGVYEAFGTSMAAPGVAGGALLLRDYFVNVWGSVCRSSYAYCKSFEPSGYLLKALIIHSGQEVRSYSESAFDAKTDIASHTLGSPPDSVQGYGSVNLHAVLPLSVAERDSQDLYLSDLFNIGGRGSASLTVKVASSKKPLKVTLLWYDRASAVGNSASSLLVVNLNMVVTSPSGVKYYGNGISEGDSSNPQEQVYISSPEKGAYTVSVSNVGSYSVNSAMVVTCSGQVTQELSLGASTTLETPVTAVSSPTGAGAGGADADTVSTTVTFSVDSVISGTSTDTHVAGQNIASVGVEAVETTSSPLFSDFDLVKAFTLHHVLSANEKVLLKTFTLEDDSLELFSIEYNLDAHYCSGSEAFIFAVMVEAPNGEIIQVGGYNEYASLDRLWQRLSPVQWTASSVPADGSSYWRSTRYVVDLELAQRGVYEVYIELMHSTWPDATYHGNVKLNFVDAETALSRSKTSNHGFFSSMGAVGAGFLVCSLLLMSYKLLLTLLFHICNACHHFREFVHLYLSFLSFLFQDFCAGSRFGVHRGTGGTTEAQFEATGGVLRCPLVWRGGDDAKIEEIEEKSCAII